MYPRKEQVAIQGRENLSYYSFNYHLTSKSFCRTCGVNVAAEWTDVSQEHLDSIPEKARKFREEHLHVFPVNVRVFDNFSLDGLPIKYLANDSGKPYQNP